MKVKVVSNILKANARIAEENRRLAVPASVGSLPTSANRCGGPSH